MSEGLLARYMEVGFPHLREVSGLPEWLVPDVVESAHPLGDQAMLELVKPLGLAKRASAFLAHAPDPDSLSIEIWQDCIGRYPAIRQALPVTMALLRACEKVDALERRGVAGIRSASTVRALATIACAPFTLKGGKMLDRLAELLGGNTTEPAELLNRYVTALVSDDKDTLSRVEECIQRDQMWTTWFANFSNYARTFPHPPRMIGVSPVISSVLNQLIATMLKEIDDADTS
jgi:hypothetical protein